MRIMSYNTLFGGFDGADDTRARLQRDIIREAAPDILLIQELKGFLDDGSARLYDLERSLGLRALVAAAPRTGQNVGVMVAPHVDILSFEPDSAHFHHAAARASLRVPGLDAPLTVVSVHLCPNGTPVRLREVSYLYNDADANGLAIVGGDFNSLAPGDPEPTDLDRLPAHFRARYVDLNGWMDRSPIATLLQAGFVDLGASIGDRRRTVPGAGFPATEFVEFRSDYLLASPKLAAMAMIYGTVDQKTAGRASDHYPVYADFLLDQP
ncbi:endonuclease/exonuclease/phosphatase family protein [Novosphingobium rosa]|jgi:endonuclease/exonuclease/phosphatase family metal-dependent hydrolase|uniref:endonuclease/exonuclease/phosphatase family protein n=1 Tax=Novosphingobium rosa TaxID=76978 RepID=UPI00082E5D16|nr:endonuclease/exonuclease/phosphatase family protein [Novosphingobium rosa]